MFSDSKRGDGEKLLGHKGREKIQDAARCERCPAAMMVASKDGICTLFSHQRRVHLCSILN